MHVANACFSKVVEGADPVRGDHKVKDAHWSIAHKNTLEQCGLDHILTTFDPLTKQLENY